MMRYNQEEPVREIAHGMLVGSQFQHFIPEVAAESSPTTAHTHVSSSAYEYHLKEMDHSYPVDSWAITAITVPVPSTTRATPEHLLLL